MEEPRLLGMTGERSAAHICKAINTTDSMQRTRYTFKALRILDMEISNTNEDITNYFF